MLQLLSSVKYAEQREFYYFGFEGLTRLQDHSQNLPKYAVKVQNQNYLCIQCAPEIYWLFVLLTATAGRSPINNFDNVWGLGRKVLHE